MKVADIISRQDVIMMKILVWRPFKPRKELFLIFLVCASEFWKFGSLERYVKHTKEHQLDQIKAKT